MEEESNDLKEEMKVVVVAVGEEERVKAVLT